MPELPLLAVAVIAMSYLGRPAARPWIQLGVPLLLCAALFIADQRTQFLACGAIVAGAFALAAGVDTFRAAAALTCIGVFLVRWIPMEDVVLWREIVVLAGVLTVLASLRDTSPLAIAAAIAVAVVTPAIPARGLLFPFILAMIRVAASPSASRAGRRAGLPTIAIALALVAIVPFARYSLKPLLVVAAIVIALPLIQRVPFVPQVAAIALFALWPWSGLLARSFPAFLRATPASPRQVTIGMALEPGQSVSVGVPGGRRTVVITSSGARSSRLRAGKLLGRIEVVGRRGGVISRDVTIGDVADFGFMRREQFLTARNRPPRHPADDIRGYGAEAWLYGAGRVTVRSVDEIASLRFTAARDLPRDARFQIESIDFE